MISVILPTFNRSHFLGATLDSILNQTFSNWECIVIDDGSKDYTQELMEFYTNKDSRIQFFKRPGNRPKGANSCRNYGFEKSTGEYIQWFDSDDLMVATALETKLSSLWENKVDYVISKTSGFEDPDPDRIVDDYRKYYQFSQFSISNFNYVAQNLNWLSPDFLGKRELCEKLRFNEKLTSSQEYNYFSKLTYYFTKAHLIDKVLTLRRMHDDSIRAIKKPHELSQALLRTWKDLFELAPGSRAEEYLLLKLADLNKREIPDLQIFTSLVYELTRQGRMRAAIFVFLYKLYFIITGKGEYLRTRFMRTLKQNWLLG